MVYHGWTKDLSQEEKDANELDSLLKHIKNNPDNVYWANRLRQYLNRFVGTNLPMLDSPHPVDEVKTQYECENCDCGVIVTNPPPFEWDYERTCPCCNGNWRDCDNCRKMHEEKTNEEWIPLEDIIKKYVEPDEQEYRMSQLPPNVTASPEWLKRNTHAIPEEKELARKNGEALNRMRKKDTTA